MYYDNDPKEQPTPAESPWSKQRRSQKPLTSFPPNRPSSYSLALSLVGMAATSALAIENPLIRTGAILVIVIVIYLIGLRTQ